MIDPLALNPAYRLGARADVPSRSKTRRGDSRSVFQHPELEGGLRHLLA
jgi:hypothetical protein